MAALQGGTAEEKEASKGDLDRAEGVLRMAQERVEAADQKREQGLKENARRRHDFVPFILKVRRRSLLSLATSLFVLEYCIPLTPLVRRKEGHAHVVTA